MAKESSVIREARARIKRRNYSDRNEELRDVREVHGYAADRMMEIVDQAENENRGLTDSERREFDELEKESKDMIAREDVVKRKMGVSEYSGSAGSAHSAGSELRFFDAEGRREIRGYRHGERIARDGDSEATFGSFVAGAIRSAMGARMTDRERRALEGATGSAGGYLVDEQLSTRFIDALRAQSVVSRAGAITLPLTGNADTFSMARIDSDPTPQWRAENTSVAEGDPEFSRIQLVPRTLAILTKIPVELVQDAANLEAVVERSLAESVGAEIDRAALWGSGVGDEPKGITKWTGVNAIDAGGALTDYSKLVSALRALKDDNVDTDAPTVAAVMAPREWETLEMLHDTTNQPLRPPMSIERLPKFTTTKIATDGGTGSNESTITIGDFGRVLLGIRQDIQVEILRELFREKLQIGVLVWARFDVALERAESFALVTGIQPAE